MKRKTLTFFIICISIIIYYNTPCYITQYAWKHNGGGRIRDMIVFDNCMSLKWPIIFNDSQKVGYVIFCFYNKLWVYSLGKNQENGLGEYTRKNYTPKNK